ncbi:HSF-type DNA-binding, partial [Thraustotheca clavata]
MPKTIAAPVFLQKTYSLFEEAPANVAAWAHQGRTVVVKDPQELARTLLPQYFKHCNFASFVRQLNFYGFRKYKREEMLFGSAADNIEEEGMQYWWEFYHPNFVRDEPNKMAMIRRKTYSEAPPTYIQSQPDEMGVLKKQVSTLQTQYTQLSNQITNLEMLVKTLIETHKRMPPAEHKEPITKKIKAEEEILTIDTEATDIKMKAIDSLSIDTATIDDVLTSPEALSISLPSSPLGSFDFPIDESSWWLDDLPFEPNSMSAIVEPPKILSPPRCSMQA